MRRIVRAALGVVVASVVWGVLWGLGTRAGQALFPQQMIPEQPIEHGGVLLGLVAYSVVLSALAGWLCATVAGRGPMAAVWVLAVLQLALGIYFEVSYWELMPAWYHLLFLALVVPATVWGGHWRERGAAASASPGASLGEPAR